MKKSFGKLWKNSLICFLGISVSLPVLAATKQQYNNTTIDEKVQLKERDTKDKKVDDELQKDSDENTSLLLNNQQKGYELKDEEIEKYNQSILMIMEDLTD